MAAGESRLRVLRRRGEGAAWRLRKAALRVLRRRARGCMAAGESRPTCSPQAGRGAAWRLGKAALRVLRRRGEGLHGGWGKPPYVFSAGGARGCMAAGESRPTCSPQAGRGDGMAAGESRPTCSPFILHSCGFVLFVDSERRAGSRTCPTLCWISASRAAGRLDGSERPYIIRSERRNGALLQPHDTHARRLRIVRNPLSRRPGAGNETH